MEIKATGHKVKDAIEFGKKLIDNGITGTIKICGAIEDNYPGLKDDMSSIMNIIIDYKYYTKSYKKTPLKILLSQ